MSDVTFILDSGAFSAWKQNVEINLDDYIAFCLEHADVIDYVVNLDVIPGEWGRSPTLFEAEKACEIGFANYYKMIDKGVPKEKLIHVFHMGDDFKWLDKMLVEDLGYIGISPANDKTTAQKRAWLDIVFKYISDAKGYPVIKTHGFGVTAHSLMLRYPWYSVDSTSWVMTSRTGGFFMPAYKNGEFDFLAGQKKISISSKSKDKEGFDDHYITMSPSKKAIVDKYISQFGFKIGESKFLEDGTEEVIEVGLSNSYKERDKLNILYYTELQKRIPEYPRKLEIDTQQGLFL